MGVTVVLLTCAYKGNEFARVGYYVNNEYTDPEMAETPPAIPVFEKVWLYSRLLPPSYDSKMYTKSYPRVYSHDACRGAQMYSKQELSLEPRMKAFISLGTRLIFCMSCKQKVKLIIGCFLCCYSYKEIS